MDEEHMKIPKLSSFFSSPAYTAPESTTVTDKPEAAAQTQPQSSEAVSFSSDIKTSSAREARVQELKGQYERGEYKPDSHEVAKALIRDLA